MYFSDEDRENAQNAWDITPRGFVLDPLTEQYLWESYLNSRAKNKEKFSIASEYSFDVLLQDEFSIEPIICRFDPTDESLRYQNGAFDLSGIGVQNCKSYVEPQIHEPGVKYPICYHLYAKNKQIVCSVDNGGIKYPDLMDLAKFCGGKIDMEFILRTEAHENYDDYYGIYQSASIGILIDRRKKRPDEIEYVIFNGADASIIFHSLYRFVTKFSNSFADDEGPDNGNVTSADSIITASAQTKKAFYKTMIGLKNYDRESFLYRIEADRYGLDHKDEFTRRWKKHVDSDVAFSQKKLDNQRHPCFEPVEDISTDPFKCIYPKKYEIKTKLLKDPVMFEHVEFGLYRVNPAVVASYYGISTLAILGIIMIGEKRNKKCDDPAKAEYIIKYAYAPDYAARDMGDYLKSYPPIIDEGLTILNEDIPSDYQELCEEQEVHNVEQALRWTSAEETSDSRILLGKFIGERVMLPYASHGGSYWSEEKVYLIHDPRPYVKNRFSKRAVPHKNNIEIRSISEDIPVVGLCIGTAGMSTDEYELKYLWIDQVIRDYDMEYVLSQFDNAYFYDFREKRILAEKKDKPVSLMDQLATYDDCITGNDEEKKELIKGFGTDDMQLYFELYPYREKVHFNGSAYWSNGELVLEKKTSDGETEDVRRIPRELIMELRVKYDQTLRCGEHIDSMIRLIRSEESLERMSVNRTYELYKTICRGERYYLPSRHTFNVI